jgi:hypothetical protein
MSDSSKEDFAFYLPILDNTSSYATKPAPFTVEELEILADLRRIKREVRDIKLHLAENHPGQADGLARRLNDLRDQWQERFRAYEEASRRRMIALGHAEPG